MATKKAIKSIKQQLKDENYESALYEAAELRKQLKKTDPEAAEVLMYQGLACLNLDRTDEAEKSYLMAYNLRPDLPLAATGIRKLYEKKGEWHKLGAFLEVLVQAAFDAGDAEACASALQDLVTVRAAHGPDDALYRTLLLLLPSSPLLPLLSPLPIPSGSYTPFPSPIYPPASFAFPPNLPKPLPHIVHLLGSLPLLLNLLIRQQSITNKEIESQVAAGRTRLGAGPEKEVRKKVEGQVSAGSKGMQLVELLREVAGHPGVDEEVRRKVEVQEFDFWRKLVGALSTEEAPVDPKKAKAKTKPKAATSQSDGAELPPTPLFDAPDRSKPSKEEALSRADGLAKGFVLLEVGGGAEDAWRWVMDSRDEPTIYYDHEFLHKLAKAFPLSPLTDFIDDYCRWFRLPMPEPEDEPAQAQEGGKEEEKKKRVRTKRGKGGGPNAKERRKARRLAHKEATLAEDIEEEEKEELVASMTKLLDKLPKSIFAFRVMARLSIQEEDWANAVSYAEKGRTLVKELELERGSKFPLTMMSLDTALGVALVPYFAPKHHPRATRLLNGVLHNESTNTEARFARAQIFQTANNWGEARKNFQMILDIGADDKMLVAAREEVGWCLVNEGKLEEGREILESVVEIRDRRWEEEGKTDEAFARARAWYRLGRTEWLIGDAEAKSNAEEWFAASIRALPTYAPPYAALGLCYTEASPPDQDRALRCFQKAFELDATEADAARRLATGYADDDEWALVRAIAMRVMEGEGGVEGMAGGDVVNPKGSFLPKNGWAWKALGSTEMYYRNFSKAASAFQIALRADPEDVGTWVLLGESYTKCGRQVAGLKALQKALELDPHRWMAEYLIANIHVELYHYDEAIQTFEKVQVMTEGKEVGITASMANAMLLLGKQVAAGGFRERSRRALLGAIKLAGQVLESGSHRAWGWKLVGDAAFELASTEPKLYQVEESGATLRPVLELLVKDDVDGKCSIEGLGSLSTWIQGPERTLNSTLEAAAFAFQYRAYLCANDRNAESALYDLATALHTLGLRLPPDSPNRTPILKSAIVAIRGALEKDAGDERFWNALGVIAATSGPAVAQHAFVVSLELYAKDPITWANLGYLYLKLEELELANQCFLKAQIIDPDYARAWLGQGMLAEKNGDKEHARGLFAHAVTLSAGSLLEADLAAAASLFEKLLAQKWQDTTMLHQPAFALRHYVHQRPNDHLAAHLYAMICERLGLIDEAVDALVMAVKLLEEEYERTESPEIEIKYSIALCNLGRIRLASKAYQEAEEAYQNCWELIDGHQNSEVAALRVQVRLGQAIAKFWLEDVEGSLEYFQHALDEAASQNGNAKEEVAGILARTLWGLGGDDAREAAKSNLMECLSSANPSIKVISLLGAIGLASHDQDLLDAVIAELRGLTPDRRTLEDPKGTVELVLSAQALSEGKVDEALGILQVALGVHPESFGTANRLARAFTSSSKAGDTVHLLETAGNWDSEAVRNRGIAKMMEGDEKGMSDLERSIRLKPWEVEGWQGLAYGRALLAEAEGDADTM